MTLRPLIVLAAALLLGAPAATAQPSMDEQLAAQYYQQGDLEKAAMYYERIFKQRPTDHFYQQLLKCHVGLNDMDAAEKLIKAQQRRNKDEPGYVIDMGSLLRTMGQDDKAAKEYEKALRMMRPEQGSIRRVANAFTRANETALALEAYERGQKMLKDGQHFHYDIANLYAAQGDVPKMVNAYLDLLSANEAYIQSVQNSLTRYMDLAQADERSELLRTELLRRIQRAPDRTIFAELLIWMYVQQKELNSAFVQSRALDKRNDEGGARLMELAKIALANGDHGNAFKCYEYVQNLGRNDGNYVMARIGLVKARYAQLMAQPEPAEADLRDLDRRAADALEELGLDRNTVDLLSHRAHLMAYHLNEHPQAVALLEEGVRLPAIDRGMRDHLKLELGDIHLLMGDIWEASLLYSQVDLDNKYDVLGHEARLRNAKVSFYAGDFLWAQAQLKVLKSSTSKLIANDAMELSLRITDNLGLDSNATPLTIYAQAELLRVQHRYDEALHKLDSLTALFPMHGIGDDVLYERYRIAHARHRYAEAAAHLEKVLEMYPLEILVDNALMDLGVLHEERLNDPEKAAEYYQRLLFEQTGSIFVPEARERFRRLRGDHLPGTTPTGHQHP
ncbi:MAG: tetratricopeptide repeat protein [Flavobacteriales bacterium]|jgi:tetratricopeptide (TPR) repeat protein|nr:tetratricopeptide repeat protein [Flavobacteriales bacterium]